MSLEDAAAIAFLSPGRFAHLFKQQVGIAVPPLHAVAQATRAVLGDRPGEDGSAAAAHAADFADAAHLTRTFYQMFGIRRR